MSASVGDAMAQPPDSMVLLHGFASTFDHNWRETGWVDILGDFECAVPDIDLPGHGRSARSDDPQAYATVDEDVASLLPGPTCAVGFSAGAEILLRVAMTHPGTIERMALLGVGDSIFETSDSTSVVDALEADTEPDDVQARLFRRLAQSTGNDPRALAAFLRRTDRRSGPRISPPSTARCWWSSVPATSWGRPTGWWPRSPRPRSCRCRGWTTSLPPRTSASSTPP